MTVELHEHSATDLSRALGVAIRRESAVVKWEASAVYDAITDEFEVEGPTTAKCPGNVDAVSIKGIEVSVVGFSPGRVRIDVVFPLQEGESVEVPIPRFQLGRCGGIHIVSSRALWWDFESPDKTLEALGSVVDEALTLANSGQR